MARNVVFDEIFFSEGQQQAEIIFATQIQFENIKIESKATDKGLGNTNKIHKYIEIYLRTNSCPPEK